MYKKKNPLKQEMDIKKTRSVREVPAEHRFHRIKIRLFSPPLGKTQLAHKVKEMKSSCLSTFPTNQHSSRVMLV